MNNNDVREINSITFGIYSPEEIMKMTVCTLDSTKKTIGPGTIYDPRMGTTDSSVLCPTCGEDAHRCVGHFGRIILHSPVVHPLFYKRVTSFLNCFCLKCCRLVIQKDQILLSGLNKFKGEARFVRILEKLKKIDICCQPTGEIDENGEPIICGKDKPKIKFITADSSYQLVYSGGVGKNDKTSIILSTEEIKKTFDNILPEDVVTLGFDPRLSHPRNFIISILPVLPPCDRPYVKADNKMCDDDLTNNYCEIIKANNNLAEEFADEAEGGGKGHGRKKDSKDTARQRALASLRFRILTTFNNCLDPATPITMWSGKIKRADEIIIGDNIIGDDGEKRVVLEICQGIDEMYEIKQRKGDTYVVNSNHILTLKYSGHRSVFWKTPSKQFPMGAWWMRWFDEDTMSVKNKTISVSLIKDKDSVYNTIMNIRDKIPNHTGVIDIPIYIYNKLVTSTKRCLMGFKLDTPIQWNTKQVGIDPYLLGMWLGDGNSNGKGFTSADPELVQYWKQWAEQNEAEVVLHPNKGKKDIYFGVKSIFNIGNDRTHFNPLKKKLDKYNLINNKHVPIDYINNDIDTRLKLLAGMIDTDGSVEENGTNIQISQCFERRELLENIKNIAMSLGFYTSMNIKKTTWTYKDVKKTGKALILHISGNISIIPTLLPHKKCFNPIKTDTSCTCISVKPIGIGQYVGFTIDKNQRFLLGDYTVTHNSQGKAKHTTNGRPIKGIKERLTGKDGQIRNNMMGEVLAQVMPKSLLVLFLIEQNTL